MFHIACLATAVAAIPATSAAVVVVVAVRVTLEFWRTALGLTFAIPMVGVEAQALLTVPILATVPVLAAVAQVVLAFGHVVHIIAEAVAQVFVNTFVARVAGIPAFTVVAVFSVHSLSRRNAAVTAVPVARFLVVAVITEFVTLVRFQGTRLLAGVAVGVQTFAFFTVYELFSVVVMTTITAIPIAFVVVVIIVTESVTLELRGFAFVYITGVAATTVA